MVGACSVIKLSAYAKLSYVVREIIMNDTETPRPKRLKLSGSDHDEPAEIYSPYYTANLRFILNSVLGKDGVDKNALKEDEICKVQQLEQLEGKVILNASSLRVQYALLCRSSPTTVHSAVFKEAPMVIGVQNKISEDCLRFKANHCCSCTIRISSRW